MIEWLLMEKPALSKPDFCSFFPSSGLMEIRSVSVGVVAIKSVSTGLYLAMSKKGTLFGSVGTSNDSVSASFSIGVFVNHRRLKHVGHPVNIHILMFNTVI